MIFPITMSCNSKCRSCGIWRLPEGGKEPAVAGLLEKVQSDRYLAANIESVNLSGGEPFSHPRIGDLILGVLDSYQRLKEICINTDGHLLETIDEVLARTLPVCRERGVKLR